MVEKWQRNWGELLWKIITSVSSFIVESKADVSVKSKDLKPIQREIKTNMFKKNEWFLVRHNNSQIVLCTNQHKPQLF